MARKITKMTAVEGYFKAKPVHPVDYGEVRGSPHYIYELYSMKPKRKIAGLWKVDSYKNSVWTFERVKKVTA